jgi:hypothetical protein
MNELTFLIKSTYIMVDALKAISDEGIDSVDDTETEVIARIKIIADKALNQYSELLKE